VTDQLQHSFTIDDIRAWGRERGIDVPDKGRLPAGLRADYIAAHAPDTPSDERPAIEIAPQVDPPKQDVTPVGRVKELFTAGKKPPAKGKTKHARVSTDSVISRIWQFGARVFNPVSEPVSNVLRFQAPVAGLILDDMVKGTIIDRGLQPLARSSKAADILFAMVGTPLLVGILDKRPQTAPVVVPMLRESLRVLIDATGPKFEEIVEYETKYQEEYGAKIEELLRLFFGVVEDPPGNE
jgi:hypothetical protein